VVARVAMDLLRESKSGGRLAGHVRTDPIVRPGGMVGSGREDAGAAGRHAVGCVLVVLETLRRTRARAFRTADMFGVSFDEIATDWNKVAGRDAQRQQGRRTGGRVRRE